MHTEGEGQDPYEDALDHSVSLDEVGDIEDTRPISLEEPDIGAMIKNSVAKTLEGLTERERMVLTRRFGLISGRPYTLKQVGIELGNQERGRPLSEARIRQIEKEALLKTRSPQ